MLVAEFKSGEALEPTQAVKSLRDGVSQSAFVRDREETEQAYRSAARVLIASEAGDKEASARSFDNLLSILLNGFPRLSPRDLYAATHGQSASLSRNGEVFPVLLVTQLLSRHKVRIDMRKVSHWSEFSDRYGPALLAC